MAKSKRIAVMGGLGFMGSHISRALVESGYSVRIFDKLYGSRSLVGDIEDKIEIFEGDAEKPEDVLEALGGMDAAVHLIHTTVPGSSMDDPAYDAQSNLVASARWLPMMKGTGVKRILYVSSGGTVYGVPRENPITEAHPTDPISSYGITKLAIEKYVALYSELAGVEHRILRPGNVYGPGQRLNIGQGVIGIFLSRALEGKPMEIWGDGSARRDYLYVGDFVEAVLALMGHRGPGRVFNVSSGKGLSLNEIVEIMQGTLGLKVKVQYKKRRGFDVPVNVLDNTLLKKETGWRPKVPLEVGMKRVHEWLAGGSGKP